MAREAVVIVSDDPEVRPMSRRTYEVQAAMGAEQERERLEELIELLHPGASLTSFEDGCATFAGGGLRFMARFVRPEPVRGARPRGQEALFA